MSVANGLRELCNVKDKGVPKQQSYNKWAGSESDTLQTIKKPQQQQTLSSWLCKVLVQK